MSKKYWSGRGPQPENGDSKRLSLVKYRAIP